jgi:hypothetical protein
MANVAKNGVGENDSGDGGNEDVRMRNGRQIWRRGWPRQAWPAGDVEMLPMHKIGPE